jgi:hypothetical protein
LGCPGRRSNSPRAVPWEFTLPWNTASLRQSAAALPVRGDHGLGYVCARAVGARTSRGVGTSVTARIRNAYDNSAAGRRRSGRLADARTMPSKPSTPLLSVRAVSMRAVSVPPFRHKQCRSPRLRRRVVTQQKFFAQPLCGRPGCYEAAPKLGRNQAHYCGRECRRAVHRVLERERKWVWRGTFQGRRQRVQEYRAARVRRSPQPADTADRPPRAPPPP